MFNLDLAIAEWRQQMLAAGVQSPVPLEELEAHLREEITRQMNLGVNGADAFNSAVREIGPASLLNDEFRKTGALYGFLSKPRALRVTLSLNGLLGLAWVFVLSNILTRGYTEIPAIRFDAKDLLVFLIFLSAIAGGVLLVFNSKWGRIVTRTNALLWLTVWSIQDCIFAYINSRGILSRSPQVSIRDDIAEQGVCFAFLLVSIVILHLPEKANLKTTVKL